MANDKDKVLNYIGYVFLYYKLQKLLDMGMEIKPEEIEKIDRMNADVLNIEYKYSCNMG